MNELAFKSKLDSWICLLLLFGALFSLLGAVLLAASGDPLAFVVTPLLMFSAALIAWVFFSTRYTLGDTFLRVRSGPLTWNISLADIRSVRATRNPCSSPALSLDRIRIDYDRSKWIMISPLHKERFFHELERRRSGPAIKSHAS